MSTYKFLNTMHLPAILNDEIVRLCTFAYYRNLEHKGKVGDPNEGLNILELPDYRDSENPVEDQKILSRLAPALVAQSGRGLTVKNLRSVRRFSGYIFCASRGSLLRLANDLCHKDPENYDACYSIFTLQAFAEHLYQHGRIVDDVPLRERVSSPHIDRVRYTGTTQDVRLGEPEPSSPFVKDAIYSVQRETRIVFRSVRRDAPDTISVHAPGIAAFLREQFRAP